MDTTWGSLERDIRKLRTEWLIEHALLSEVYKKYRDPHTEGKMDKLDMAIQGLDRVLEEEGRRQWDR